MQDQGLAMRVFARLARVSHERQQQLGCDRFLVIAGMMACHSGWLEVAASCRAILARHNPKHFVAVASSFPEALRDPANERFFTHAAQFCSFERAEHLLAQHGGLVEDAAAETPGDSAMRDLHAIV